MEGQRPSYESWNDPLRVLLCHDTGAVDRGLNERFDDVASVDVVGEAHGPRACLRLALELRPDVVLLDLAMPVLDGLKTFKLLRARCSDLPCVVMLSSFDARRFRNRVLELGAPSYVDKTAALDELVSAIRYAAADPRAAV